MSNSKKVGLHRRSLQTRKRIALLERPRLSIWRTNCHIYANLYSSDGSKVLASASTLEAAIKEQLVSSTPSLRNGGSKQAASIIGNSIATKSLALGFVKVAFDRSGFAYHGRVAALADAAREAGLDF